MGRDGVRVDGMMMMITPMGENCLLVRRRGRPYIVRTPVIASRPF